ncbi:MAG: WecB/TagA/CpsF family glycosyltransferase [Planctomycetota bacterium]
MPELAGQIDETKQATATAAPQPPIAPDGRKVGHVPGIGSVNPSPAMPSAASARQPSVARVSPVATAPPSPPTIALRGVEFHAVTQRQTVDHILRSLDAGKGGSVITPNLDHLRRMTRDLAFGALVSEADLVVADGMPLIWASRLQGTPLPERVAGSDLISTLSEGAARAGRSVFLLGGEPGTADGAAKILQKCYPGLKIAGTYCPDFGFEHSPEQMGLLVEALVEAQPDIVFVGLGSPKQENLVDRIHHNLPDTWWLGVGVSFSFLCGHVSRAPSLLQKVGLEWTHRLVQEPRRLFKRYIVHGLPFATVLMRDAVSNRVHRRLGTTKAAETGGHFPRPRRYSANPAAPTIPGPAPTKHSEAGPGRTTRGVGGSVSDRLAQRLDQANRPQPAAVHGVDAVEALRGLRSLVLLSGKLRDDAFSRGIRRPLLELPLSEEVTLLDHWLTQAVNVAGHVGLPKLPVAVAVNRGATMPQSTNTELAELIEPGHDRGDYRGTGGVLKDLAAEYADDEYILVANAAQLLLDPLAALARALAGKHADVAIVGHEDGTPSGLMLIRVATLRCLPDVGYFDLKEQGLPVISKAGFSVRVLKCRRPTALPIRSADDYITALRLFHAPENARRGEVDPLEDAMGEGHRRRFSVVESGAEVAEDAYLHDAVVLRGARVGRRASLVRSVVCANGEIPDNGHFIDDIAGCRGT